MSDRDNISDWLNRADYTAEERRNICGQLLSEAQYWDSTQYQRMMHDSTKRPWVDLTDEDISEIAINNPPMVHEFARAVLTKSKEKNT